MERVPPHRVEAEKAVLGAVLLDNKTYSLISRWIKGDHFYIPAHRLIFEAAASIITSGGPADLVTILEYLKESGKNEMAGGVGYLNQLTDSVVSVQNAEKYAKMIREMSIVRNIISSASMIAAEGYSIDGGVDEYISMARREISSATSDADLGSGPQLADTDLGMALDDIESGKMPDGVVKTGIDVVDKFCGGLMPGLLTVVGGRPGMGKSVFALNVGMNAALMKRKVLYMPLEDSRYYATIRLLARFGDVDANDLMMRRAKPDQFKGLVEAAEIIHGKPLWIDDSAGLTSDRIQHIATHHKNVHGLDLLIIDHLGEVGDKGENLTAINEVACRRIRDIAKDLLIPVLLITQLNREVEKRSNKRPTLADLRQSGAIEQAARFVWFLYRPGYYRPGGREDPDTELIIAKSTHGKTGAVRLHFDGSRMYMRGWDTSVDGTFPQEGEKRHQEQEFFE